MRAVGVLGGGGGLLTASRDRTARVWRRGQAGGAWAAGEVLAGHSGFVTSCAAGPAEGEELLATGSRDKSARVWRAAAGGQPPACLGRAEGHSEQVSGVAWLPAEGGAPRLATSSLDGTVRVWAAPGAAAGGDGAELACLAVLEGHGAPVQCVIALGDGGLATGSGDRTVRVWREEPAAGAWTCAGVLEGHEDTVRGLTAMPGGRLASASHDGSLRLWGPAGDCARVFTGHSAIVFCVAASPDGELLASGSDDGTCRVWRCADGAALQTLAHPGCVWSAAFLPGGELATACSDGVVRVWSRDPDQRAGPTALAAFEAAVAAREESIRRAQNPGGGDGEGGGLPEGLKIEDSVALQFAGTKSGEIKVVKEGSGAMAYQWDAAQGSWEKIGEVMAGAEKPAAGPGGGGAGKVVDGVTYDFVFDVDVADGQPPLRLPYNRGEDVYQAAERFILRNELPATYREQIVNFIVQNTPGGSALGGASPAGNVDPFTSGGAYVPPAAGGAGARSGAPPPLNADPFTGSGGAPAGGGGGASRSACRSASPTSSRKESRRSCGASRRSLRRRGRRLWPWGRRAPRRWTPLCSGWRAGGRRAGRCQGPRRPSCRSCSSGRPPTPSRRSTC